MQTVRAKFRCEEITQGTGGHAVKLLAVTSGSPENAQFFKYTPSGAITLAILNPEAAAAFVVGAEYYVDFSPAA